MANTIDEALVDHNGYILGEDVATYATYNYRKLHGPATRHAKSPKFSSGGYTVSNRSGDSPPRSLG